MKKKKTIGDNPLSLYLGTTKAKKAPEPKQPQKTTQPKKQPTNDPYEGATQRVTIHVNIELINAIKDAVFWEPGLTLTAFAHIAFTKALEALEKKKGSKYPKRKEHNLKGGRPLL